MYGTAAGKEAISESGRAAKSSSKQPQLQLQRRALSSSVMCIVVHRYLLHQQ